MKHSAVPCADACTYSTATLEAARYSEHYDSPLRPQVGTEQKFGHVVVSFRLFPILYKPQP